MHLVQLFQPLQCNPLTRLATLATLSREGRGLGRAMPGRIPDSHPLPQGARVVNSIGAPSVAAAETGCGKRASVMLSPFAALRIDSAKHLHFLIENKQLQILRGVYPERKLQILRFAQDDSEGLRMTP